MNRLYTMRLRDSGFVFSRAICVTVKYAGHPLLKK